MFVHYLPITKRGNRDGFQISNEILLWYNRWWLSVVFIFTFWISFKSSGRIQIWHRNQENRTSPKNLIYENIHCGNDVPEFSESSGIFQFIYRVKVILNWYRRVRKMLSIRRKFWVHSVGVSLRGGIRGPFNQTQGVVK